MPKEDRFRGPFLISAFEVLALGLGFNIRKYTEKDAGVVAKTAKTTVWAKADFLTSSGVRATQRLPKTVPFGRTVFKK
jgi:hypothetical protein